MDIPYKTIAEEQIETSHFLPEEKLFLGEMISKSKSSNYLDFENQLTEQDSPIFSHAKRLGKPISETPLYKICEDLATRLGIRQGYLVREEIVSLPNGESMERKELTTGQVANLAGCTREAVRKAIREGRLRARRVGRLSLVWENDAQAFAARRGMLMASHRR
jgi:excisionase family DNA binding protein